MGDDTVQQMLRRQPFEPFEIRLSNGEIQSNGEIHVIRHTENAALGRTRLVIMYPDTETDRMVICDLSHINAIEVARRS
jgi:hypothetical protein